MARKNDDQEYLFDRTLPIRRVRLPKRTGAAGLWADGPTSYFDNSRSMRTVDPSEVEQDLGTKGRNAVAWCTSLEKTGGTY